MILRRKGRLVTEFGRNAFQFGSSKRTSKRTSKKFVCEKLRKPEERKNRKVVAVQVFVTAYTTENPEEVEELIQSKEEPKSPMSLSQSAEQMSEE